MKYVVYATREESEVSLERTADDEILLTAGRELLILTSDEFRELRKAVGYVWQEIEQNA